jgi:hypothetical protein
VIYHGPVIAIHLRGIWNTMQDTRATITRENKLSLFESFLQNSGYFLAKSQQTLLTRSMGSSKESNRRCYYLNVEKLTRNRMLEEFIEKAREYEQSRGERFSF